MTAVVGALLLGGSGVLGLLVWRWWDRSRWADALVRFRLTLPSGLSVAEVSAWLGALAVVTRPAPNSLVATRPVGIEVDATAEGITCTLLVGRADQAAVLASLRAELPAVRLERLDDAEATPPFSAAVELRLSNWWRQLATDRAEVTARATLAALQPVLSGTHLRVQFLLVGTQVRSDVTTWPSLGRVVLGLSPTPDQRSAELARKASGPLLLAAVRVAVSGSSGSGLLRRLTATLRGMDTPDVAVVPRVLPGWLVRRWVAGRHVPLVGWPLVLGAAEAAGLVPLAAGGVVLPGLDTSASRALPLPPTAPMRGVVLGESTYPVGGGLVRLPMADRLRHVYVLGPTGVGKSHLLAQMVLSDIAQGYGGLVIDPKADLVDTILARVAPADRDRLIVLDPASDRPVGLNPLRASGSLHQRELAAETTVTILRNIFRSYWGPRTDDLLRAAVATLTSVPAPDGSHFTLVEVPELLTSSHLRSYATAQPGLDERWRDYWHEFNALSDADQLNHIGPVLNKLRSFSHRTSLRTVFGQSDGLDLNTIFTQRRVVLVPLGKGVIGSEAATLLGAFIVGAFWAATLSRATVPLDQRRPVVATLDEFQNIVRFTDDVADMAAEARGLGVSLTLANQYFKQLPDAIRTAILGTVRSHILFQLDYDDARLMERRLAPVLSAADLTNLPTHEVVARLSVGGTTRPPVTARTLPLPPVVTDPAVLRAELADRWGTPRAEVETAGQARRRPTRPVRLGEVPAEGDES